MTRMIMMSGRTVRRVPMDYKHPTRGELQEHYGSPYLRSSPEAPASLFFQPYDEALRKWWAEREAWIADGGLIHDGYTFEEYQGPPPDPASYLREPLPPEDAEHPYGIQLWETVSEGSPLSPVFPDSEQGRRDLAEYMAEHDTDSILSHLSASEWLRLIGGEASGTDIQTGELV